VNESWVSKSKMSGSLAKDSAVVNFFNKKLSNTFDVFANKLAGV